MPITQVCVFLWRLVAPLTFLVRLAKSRRMAFRLRIMSTHLTLQPPLIKGMWLILRTRVRIKLCLPRPTITIPFKMIHKLNDLCRHNPTQVSHSCETADLLSLHTNYSLSDSGRFLWTEDTTARQSVI